MSCQVYTAIPLAETLKAKLLHWLALSNIPADQVSFKIKKDLLCGLKISYNGRTLDLSGKYRLESIEKQIGAL